MILELLHVARVQATRYQLVIADSFFHGLPPDDEDVGTDRRYQVEDFAGSRPEVEQNVRKLGDVGER